MKQTNEEKRKLNVFQQNEKEVKKNKHCTSSHRRH